MFSGSTGMGVGILALELEEAKKKEVGRLQDL
jgi:hypothetical protein